MCSRKKLKQRDMGNLHFFLFKWSFCYFKELILLLDRNPLRLLTSQGYSQSNLFRESKSRKSGVDLWTTMPWELQRLIGKSTKTFQCFFLFCERIKFWKNNNIRYFLFVYFIINVQLLGGWFIKHLFRATWRIKQSFMNYLKTVFQFRVKIIILVVKNKCSWHVQTIPPSSQSIETCSIDIDRLEITNIIIHSLFSFSL